MYTCTNRINKNTSINFHVDDNCIMQIVGKGPHMLGYWNKIIRNPPNTLYIGQHLTFYERIYFFISQYGLNKPVSTAFDVRNMCQIRPNHFSACNKRITLQCVCVLSYKCVTSFPTRGATHELNNLFLCSANHQWRVWRMALLDYWLSISISSIC